MNKLTAYKPVDHTNPNDARRITRLFYGLVIFALIAVIVALYLKATANDPMCYNRLDRSGVCLISVDTV